MRKTGTAPLRRWGPLTAELRNTKSPVTQFIKQRFPNIRHVQQRYRDSVGPLVVDGGDAHPGTLGTAFDWAVRFLVHPQPSVDLALRGADLAIGAYHTVGSELEPILGAAATELAEHLGVVTRADGTCGIARFDGPAAASMVDQDILLRGCWALALLTEVLRAGTQSGSPLWKLAPDGIPEKDELRAADLLGLAAPGAVEELRRLGQLAYTALLPQLAKRSGPWALGPTFEGSRLMNADADLIASGLLIEIKTNLGDKRADGSRRASLEYSTLQQLLGYVLLDFSDEFAIQEIGLYAARYSQLTTWPLPDLLEELAGRPMNLAAERQAFHTLLLGGRP